MSIKEAYDAAVLWIIVGTGGYDALVHVHAGMAVLLVARLVTRRSLATPIPFLVVCVVAFANEIVDRFTHGSWRWSDTSFDIANTLLWPFVLMVGLRVRRLRHERLASITDAKT